ncbi:MAG TPA: ATP-binding protein [Gammaproteobacteria bacterium]|nr:ATP-binding protein [Gammaproteobacteria bacterium]
MGLFWKIFVSFSVAMTATLVLTVLLSFRMASQAFDQINIQGRDRIIQEAAQALDTGGEWRLKIWLLQHPRVAPGTVLLVLDDSGNELLGRALPGAMLRLLRTKPFRRNERPQNVRPVQLATRIIGTDGREYRLLFSLAPFTFLGVLTWPGTPLSVLTIASLASALTSLALARYLSSPIVRLQKASRALAAGALDTRVGGPVNKRKDEVGRLARDFDAMAERLQALVMDKEALLRDVSHEFRSPLARIRVALALAERRAGQEAQVDLARIEHEAERLNDLVGQVMTLARLRTDSSVAHKPVVLDELLSAIIADARFEHPDVRIAYQAAAVPTILGDSQGLKSALENVVRNALAHGGSGPQAEFEVRLEPTPSGIVIRVLDRGPGVPEEALKRIFEPFYRVDVSRDHRTDGQGIGLAITARVMELHGGGVTARNRAGGGLEVELRLPAEQPQLAQTA